jgi:lipopolysaccharide/colanic/teichoic acid biosynthesis glycosyltransferase
MAVALTKKQLILKRGFDILFSAFGLCIFGWLILLAYVLASIDTGKSGLFIQERVGKDGVMFRVFKIRTMADIVGLDTTVTTKKDSRITALGSFWRRTKIDELPQLWNVLSGSMSFVGPRPDVLGFADQLIGQDRIVLAVRPGITGPATLKFRNEEEILARHEDPEKYNRTVIYPEKVRLNREYVENYSFANDIRYILQTVFRT